MVGTTGESATHNAATTADIAITTVTGSGANAVATVVTSETAVTSITITTAGTNYASGDEVKILASAIPGRSADLLFTLVSDDISSGGLVTTADALLDSTTGETASYTKGTHTSVALTTVTGSGTGGQVTVITTDSAVTSINVTNAGHKYVIGDKVKILGNAIGRSADLIFVLEDDDLTLFSITAAATRQGGKH